MGGSSSRAELLGAAQVSLRRGAGRRLQVGASSGDSMIVRGPGRADSNPHLLPLATFVPPPPEWECEEQEGLDVEPVAQVAPSPA